MLEGIVGKVKNTAKHIILASALTYFGYVGYVNPAFKIDQEPVKKILQKINNNTFAIGFLIGTYAFPYLISRITKKNKPYDLAKYNFLNSLALFFIYDLKLNEMGAEVETLRKTYLPFTALTTAIYYIATSEIQQYKKPKLKNFFKAKYHGIKLLKELNEDTPLEKRLELIKKVEELYENPVIAERGYFLAQLQNGNYELAMQHYLKAIKNWNKQEESKNAWEKTINRTAIELYAIIKPKVMDPLGYIVSKNIPLVIDFFEQKANPTIQEICAYANTLEEIINKYSYFKGSLRTVSKQELEEKKTNTWKKAVEEIEKQKKGMKNIKDSTVFIVDPNESPYLSNFFIFKKTNEEKLKEERELTNLVRENISSEEFGVPEEIKTIEIEGKCYATYRLNEGELLIGKDVSAYCKAAKYLAKIHKKIKTQKQRDYFGLLEKRIEGDIYEDIREKVMREIKIIINKIRGENVFDKDAQAKNWIVNGEKIIAIDFENKGMINQYRDLAKLIESGRCHLLDEKWQILDAYFDEFGMQNFKQNFLLASLLEPINAHYFLNEFNKDIFENYLINAKNNLEIIRKERGYDFRNLERVYERMIRSSLHT